MTVDFVMNLGLLRLWTASCFMLSLLRRFYKSLLKYLSLVQFNLCWILPRYSLLFSWLIFTYSHHIINMSTTIVAIVSGAVRISYLYYDVLFLM